MLARTSRPAACALLAALAGCAEEPSFQLGWRISTDPAVTEPADAPPLSSVKQCSESGIEKVRLQVRGADDPTGAELRYVKDYACFPGAFGVGESIDGPELPPGEYELELIGLRRNGSEWCEAENEDEGEDDCVRDQGTVTVRAGELPELEFLLHAPDQCDDGVDNDRDGRVDSSDPACTLGQLVESFDSGLTLFQLSVGFLDNPLIEPQHIGITAFALTIDDQPFETIEPVAGLDALWPWRFSLLSERLDAGPHTLGMVVLGSDGPLSEPETHDFIVDAEEGAFVIHEFGFGSDEFLEPIVGTFNVTWGLGTPGAAPPCESEYFVVDDVRARVVEGGGDPLGVDQVTVDGMPPLSEEAGGWLVFECHSSANLSSSLQDPLTWTEAGYSLEFEGRIGGVSCFASGAVPLRPGDARINVFAPRVLDDEGEPPPGCEECLADEDCGDVQFVACDGGLCVPK